MLTWEGNTTRMTYRYASSHFMVAALADYLGTWGNDYYVTYAPQDGSRDKNYDLVSTLGEYEP